MAFMRASILAMYILLSGCASTEPWMYDGLSGLTLDLHSPINRGEHKVVPCGNRKPEGTLTLHLENAPHENIEFCTSHFVSSPSAHLHVSPDGYEFCFCQGFFSESNGVLGGGYATTNCHIANLPAT